MEVATEMWGGDYYMADEKTLGMVMELINKHHQRLAGCLISVMFRDTNTWKSQGRDVWGKSYKVAGWQHAVLGWDFLIMLHRETWENLTIGQRYALLDHELLHLEWDTETEKGSLAAHDFEGFVAELDRHGTWQADLRRLEKRMQQRSLFDKGEAE